MASHQYCINGVVDDSKYSAPVPVIGVYIAAASLVCCLAMLHDIISGFHHGKQWIPCRWFSLNSVTLTLLGIAAKLPVDLTTSMPRTLDQVSKLTGTSIICISMGFLMLSLGTYQSSECLNNLAALSILVVTVVVNICIQIRTGVIVLFITEHIIVMCFMLLVLMVLWVSAVEINKIKDFTHDHNKDLITTGQGSMLQRLKLAYLYGFTFNPQFRLCRHGYRTVVSLLCLACYGVVIQAVSKSSTLKFCGGISQYDWSMQTVVVTQIITITVGSFAILFRSLVMFGQDHVKFPDIDRRDVIYSNPQLRIKKRYAVSSVLLGLMHIVVGVLTGSLLLLVKFIRLLGCKCLIEMVVGFIEYVLLQLVRLLSLFLCLGDIVVNAYEDIDEYEHLIIRGDVRLDKWSLHESVRDMTSWVGLSKAKSLNHLSQLLKNTLPSQPLQHNMQLKDHVYPNQQGFQVSSLSMALLVRIVQVSIPSEHSELLVKTYTESHEIVHFVDNKINSASFRNRRTCLLAEALWLGPDFSRLLPKISETSTEIANSQSHFDLNRALAIIKGLKTALPSDLVWDELGRITDFITSREYSSIEVLYKYIEQMLVDMFHLLLAQLPDAVFKYVTESPPEKFDKRVKLALKFLCQIESLQAQVAWSFPAQCNISSLITTEVPTIQTRVV